MKVPPLVNPGLVLSADEQRHFSRQIVIPELSLDGQSRLKHARVLCVGAGGLGSPALLYLAAAGVGTLGIVDFDTVDESNLHRQILFGKLDIGKKKAEVAQHKINQAYPFVEVVTFITRLDNSNALAIFSDFDIIIDATDNFATRYLINDAAVLLNKPYAWGSVNRFDGQAAIFWNTYGPCYRCVHPVPPAPGSVQNCAEAGVLGVTCASIASLQVNEVIKAITGIGDLQIGKLLVFDSLESNFTKVEIRKDPSCSLCSENPTQTRLLDDYEVFCGNVRGAEISASELQNKISAADDFILIDVREPEEFDHSRIPNSILIPSGLFADASALAQLPRNKEIILHCHSGIRSAQCLEIIQKNGFTNSRHLRGGIVAWEKL
jgi:adenylyltransferase/sulfurtransferase